MVTENVIIRFRADGTRVVERDVKKIGKASKESSSSVGFLTKALAAIGGTVVLRSAVRTLADFEQQMSTVRAITNATASDFEALRATAKDLGTTTRFSATEAGKGLENLSRAGFTVSEAIETVETTLKLAQAGALDLGTSAEIVASAVRGFRVEVGEAGRFADVLALTAASAATDVFQLGEAIKFVAPAAASLKVPFETASAALGVLGDNALRGSTGGTGLRKVLSTLAKGTPDLEKALKRVNLTLEDVDVSTVGLVPALEALRQANIGVGDAFKIFGDRGQPAFDVLVNNIDKVKEFDVALQNAGGTVDRIADIMDDNLNGALLAVRSAFEGLILSFGELGPTNALTQALRALASGLRFLADNAEVVATVLIGLSTFVIPTLIKAVNRLGVAILANPIGAIGFVVIGVIATLVKFRNEIKIVDGQLATLGDFALEAFEKLQIGVEVVAGAFSDAFNKVILPALAEFAGTSEFTFRDFVFAVAGAFDTVVGIVKGSFFVIAGLLESFPTVVKNTFLSATNFIVDVINSLILFVQRQLNAILERVEVISAQIPEKLGGGLLNLGRVTLPLGDIIEVTGKGLSDIPKQIVTDFKLGLESANAGTELATALFAGAEERARERAREVAEALLEEARRVIEENVLATAGLFGPSPLDGGPRVGPSTTKKPGEDKLAEKRAIDELIGSMKQEAALLKETGAAREILAARFEAINALQKDKIDANSIEGQQLLELVAQQSRQNEVLNERERILAVLGPTEEQRLITQEALKMVAEELNLTLEQQNAIMAKLGGGAEMNKGFFDGFAKAIFKVDTSMEGLGATIGGLLLGAIDKASGALAEFLVNGARDTEALKEALANLLRDLAKEIVQVIIKLLIVAALKKALGGDAFSPAGAPPGVQAGGFVQAGQERIVGEQGPEPFVPTQSGRVLPNASLQQPAPPSITIVNSSDPDEIASFLNSDEGGDVIMNQLGKRNKEARDVLGA